MIRPFILGSMLATSLVAQGPLERLLHQRFPAGSAASMTKVLDAATNAGLIRTASDRALAKRVFFREAMQGRHRTVRRAAANNAPWPVSGPVVPAVISESEYNDSAAYADDLGSAGTTPLQGNGDIGTGERDWYTFNVPASGKITARLVGRGSTPVTSGRIEVYGQASMFPVATFSSSSALPTGTVDLPPGDYNVQVEDNGSTGGYTVELAWSALTLPTSTPSTNLTVPVSSGLTGVRLVIPSDGLTDLRINGGTIDTILEVYDAKMNFIYSVDDDTRSTALDAGLLTELPSGLYYLQLSTYGSAGNVTLSHTATAGATPSVACSGSLTRSLPSGEEDLQLTKVTTTMAQELTLSLQPGGTTPSTDTYLIVLDAGGTFVLESDDDDAFVGSIVSGTFPAGTYYMASAGIYDNNGYTASVTCGAPRINTGGLGHTNATLVADGNETFGFAPQTPVPAEFEATSTALDPQLAVLNAAGRVVAANDDFNSTDSKVGVMLPAGTYYSIVKEYDGAAGALTYIANPAVTRSATNNVVVTGKAGNQWLLLASASRISPTPVIPQISGFLLVNLGQGVSAGPLPVPATGTQTFSFQLPAGAGAALQVVEFNATTVTGSFRNVLD